MKEKETIVDRSADYIVVGNIMILKNRHTPEGSIIKNFQTHSEDWE